MEDKAEGAWKSGTVGIISEIKWRSYFYEERNFIGWKTCGDHRRGRPAS
ncbi:MAG: hypothetical protein V8S96_02235 [Lachnospiraceae bacterium]